MNTIGWLFWLAASVAAASLTRNPLYLILILLSTHVVFLAQPKRNVIVAAIPPARLSLVLVAAGALLNLITSHHGETILFRLPASLPLIGGAYTLEAAAYGAINGCALATVVIAFLTFHAALPLEGVIRLVPRSFFPLAVVVSIAMTYLPATLQQAEQIREAQAIRGHQLRGLRSWVPLFIPLLVGGLERAFQLAESIASRGFSSSVDAGYRLRYQLAMLAGVGIVIWGWLWGLQGGSSILSALLILMGLAATGWVFYVSGKEAKATRYRQENWSRQGIWAVLVPLTVSLLMAWSRYHDPASSLIYQPYPRLSLPGFDPLLALLPLGLLAPVLLRLNR